MPIVDNPPANGSRLDCGHILETPAETIRTGSGGTGYARIGAAEVTACYPCAAASERADMEMTGRAILYLSGSPAAEVTNWSGHLSFPVIDRTVSRTNGFGQHRGMERIDIRFNGPDGFVWYGRHQGDGNTFARCRRTKERIKG